MGVPVRDFNVGTFRRLVNVGPGDLFESRYFLVLGDVDHMQSTIADRDLVSSATYNLRTIDEQDSDLLAWQILDENGTLSIEGRDTEEPSDFLTYALPVNGSKPLFLFADANGSQFVSVDPYALSDTPYDGETDYRGILGFVLPLENTTTGGNYVDLQTVFAGNDNYLNTDPDTLFFALPGVAGPSMILGDVNQDGTVNFLDIASFIALLTNGGFLEEADFNQDNVVNFLDIAPFIELLSSN